MPYTKTPWVANVTPVTAASMNNIEAGIALAPGTELAYAQFTAGVVLTSSAEASAVVLATCPAVVFDGSPVMVECFVPYFILGGGGPPAVATAWLYLDGASIGGIASASNPGSVTGYVSASGFRRMTPSAASHVFSLRATASPTGASAVAGVGGAAADTPGFIRVTRV